MLDALTDQYYTYGMDNIFISEKFLWAAYAETNYKTMVHGVFRKNCRGLPNFIVQEDFTKDRKR